MIPQRPSKLVYEERRVFSAKLYRGRNVVERCIRWLKDNRRLGLRYEKLATSFLAMVEFALIRRYLRNLEPLDWT